MDRRKIFRCEIILASIYGGEKAEMNVNEEETEIIIGETYPKIKKGKKIEVPPGKPLMEFREYTDRFLIRPKYSDIDEVCKIIENQSKTGGLVRQPVLDGAGRSTFEWVFAGNARTQQDGRVWSDTCDPMAKPDWSLGSNTLEIEAKLRKHKQQELYTEVTPKKQRRGGKRIGAGRPKNFMNTTYRKAPK